MVKLKMEKLITKKSDSIRLRCGSAYAISSSSVLLGCVRLHVVKAHPKGGCSFVYRSPMRVRLVLFLVDNDPHRVRRYWLCFAWPKGCVELLSQI